MRKLFMVLVVTSSAACLAGCGASSGLFGSGNPVASTPQSDGQADRTPAGASKARPDDSFVAFDRDSNGFVPKAEMEEGISSQFRKDDLNGDGTLDAREVRVVNDRLMAQPGGSPVIDWNADGKVTMPEYASQWRTLFDRADVNGDGTVDAEERAGRARVRKPPPLPQPELGGYRGKSSLAPVP